MSDPRDDHEAQQARKPPYSLEAERAVLGSSILNPECAYDVLATLAPNDFFKSEHGLIFQAIARLVGTHNTRWDLIGLVDEIRAAGELEAAGGHAYLASLLDGFPTSALVLKHVRKVRQLSMLRELIRYGSDLVSTAYAPVEDVGAFIDSAERDLLEVTSERGGDGLEPADEAFEAAIGALDSEVPASISTGFKSIDDKTGGLRGGHLIFLAGRPSMGKTSLGLAIAEAVSFREGAPVAFFSLEMSKADLAERMISIRSHVPLWQMRKRLLSTESEQKARRAAGELRGSKLLLNESADLTPLELAAYARRAHRREPLGLIVVDYLQLMTVRPSLSSREREVSVISRSLKSLSKELDVPILALCQLNRECDKRADKRPMTSDLRESGSLEQDADMVWLVYRDDFYHPNSQDQGMAEVIVAKNRHGPVGTARLQFIGEQTRFAEQSCTACRGRGHFESGYTCTACDGLGYLREPSPQPAPRAA